MLPGQGQRTVKVIFPDQARLVPADPDLAAGGFLHPPSFRIRQPPALRSCQDPVLHARQDQGVRFTRQQVTHFSDHYPVLSLRQGGDLRPGQGAPDHLFQVTDGGPPAAQQGPQLFQHVRQQLPDLSVDHRLPVHFPVKQVFFLFVQAIPDLFRFQKSNDRFH